MRHRPPTRLALLAPLLLATAACAELWQTVPPRPAASEDQAVVAAEFPRLAEVPARPQLGYALEQRREIAEGLVADRANARHAGDALRRDSGRPVAADTAPPLPPEPPPPAVADDTSADLALAYIEEALARDSDDGSLGDFLDRLEQPPPGSAAAAAAVAGSGPGELPAPPADPGAATAVERTASIAGPAAEAAPAIELAAAPEIAARPAPALPLRLSYAADAVELAAGQRAAAAALARETAAAVLVVSGGGPRPGLAMERARRVAAVLVEAGLPPERIAIEMAGDSDEVIVYEAGAEAG